jgi:tRNA-5-methyluridine54 2-sulfurtransferase
MRCEKCDKKAVSSYPYLCSQHFDDYILQTTQATIDRFSLCSKETNILVAVSGGKDSLALVDVLLRLGYKVTGLYVDEGIAEYREQSNADLDVFSKQRNFSVVKKFFKEEFGFTLDQALLIKKYHPCTVCGTLRRYVLSAYSKNAQCIATGHNLDDESQTILMNIFRGNTDLFLRLGPKSQEAKQFTQRIKPFYFLTEKQILTYTLLRNITVHYGECPYAFASYRAKLRDELNKKESLQKGTKRNIVETYLKIKLHTSQNKTIQKENMRACELCLEPSQDIVCKACKLKKEINAILLQ